MDTIKTYLDNMFTALPKTEQAERMKQDLYNNMIEKY